MSEQFPAGGFDPRMFEQVPLFRELAKVMSWTGGPVNWDLARQTAGAVAGGSPGAEDTAAFSEAVRVAELWLDEATGLPEIVGPVEAFSATAWVEQAATSRALGRFVEPLAAGMREALGAALPPELGATFGGGQQGPMDQMLGALGALLYGLQVGSIAGSLSEQLLGCYDLGVPVLDAKTVGTVGTTLTTLADDYGLDATELRYWLALREAVHRRMFAGVAWLPEHVTGLIERFAGAAQVDAEGLLDTLGGFGLDPTDPTALQGALEQPDAFRIEPTAAQTGLLAELRGLLTFTEGYSELAAARASDGRLGSLDRIEETMRRRRAEQGPGERMLNQLLGLDLTPTDLRLGRGFCEAVTAARGVDGLDRAWQDPEHLPSQDELADPSRWLVRMAAVELGIGDDPQA